jgi:hypothetical protein
MSHTENTQSNVSADLLIVSYVYYAGTVIAAAFNRWRELRNETWEQNCPVYKIIIAILLLLYSL